MSTVIYLANQQIQVITGTPGNRKISVADCYTEDAPDGSIINGMIMDECLMQMAKTSAAIEKFSEHGGLYISYLTHPTTGGVTASFATLGDITLAEPDALIGFAGPRVIEQTIGQKLPDGFQRSEFQMAHGFVDQIVPRDKMREVISHILRLHAKKGR